MNDLMRPGVWGVLATPFAGSTLDVDESGVAQLAEHSAGAGVAGLTVLGVFGEAARLSLEERALVLETVLDTVDLPLVVGCSSLATAPVIDEVTMATELVGDRLAGVMVQANSADKTVLKAHLDAINEATGAHIVLQDYPKASGVSVSPSVLASVVARSPYVCAVKVESPPTPAAIAALHASSDVLIFGGLGGINLLDELACGAAGAMTGFSFPEALVACVQAWRDGDRDTSRSELLNYLPLITFEQQAGIALAIRKECLRKRGLIAESAVRPPGRNLPEPFFPLLEAHLEALGALR